jgi:WD40 repeat protein
VEVPPALGRRINEACDRFEAAWRSGMGPLLEEFVAGWEGAERAALLRELVPLDADYRRGRGEPVSPDDYRGRFPELGDGWLVENVGGAWPTADTTTAPGNGKALREHGPLPGGSSFGDYEILEEIGRGGMGVVYRARQRRLNRVVALKMILAGEFPTPSAVQRFCDEAENVARLDHPHIVPVHEVGEHNGLPYFSMKYIEGGSLSQRLTQGTPLKPRELAALMAKVARAVHHAHQRGILHRDLKPGNILLDGAGEPYVADFGLAKRVADGTGQAQSGAIVGTDQTQAGVIVGTAAYIAPEQACERADRPTTATDVYGLGAVLYEVLAGRPPFRGETTLETLRLVVTQEPVPPSRLRSAVPRDLEVICQTCLRKEPEKRYESALALAEDLERWLAGEPIRKRAVGRVERTVRWMRRHPTGTALLAVIAATVLALLGGWAYFTAELQGKSDVLSDEVEKGRKREAEKARQLERTRRTLFTAQQWRAAGVWDHDPAQALRLLEDVEACPIDLRDFTWRLYHRACHRQRHALKGHTSELQTLAFSGDGKALASADRSGTVKLWDVVTGRERATLRGHKGPVFALAFSPDGRTLASGGADKTARLWDIAGGWERACFQAPFNEEIYAVAFRPDGETLIAVGARAAEFWEIGTGRLQKMVPHGLGGNIRDKRYAALTPDGNTLAVRDLRGNGAIRVWEVSTGKELAVIDTKDNPDIVSVMALSPDGRLVVQSGAQGSLAESLRIWNVAAARPRCTLQDCSMPGAGSLEFSTDSRTLAIGYRCGLVRLWDADTGRHRVTFECETDDPVRCLALAPDGRTLATGGEPDDEDNALVKVWDIAMDLAKAGAKHPSGRPWLSRNGLYQVVSEKRERLWVWDVLADRPHTAINHRIDNNICGGKISPDGRTIVGYRPVYDEKGNFVGDEATAWDVETGKARWTIIAHPDIQDLEYSSDGKTLASGASDGSVHLWNAADGTEKRALRGLAKAVRSLALTPDGRVVAAMGLEDAPFRWEVRLWDATSGKERATIHDESGADPHLAFSPDGSLLAVAGDEKVRERDVAVIWLWDVATGQERARLRGRGERYCCVAFTPDGKNIAVGARMETAALPGEVDLWDIPTGQLRASLRGHPQPVTFVAFSPDGNALVSASDDGTVKVWDATPLPSAPQSDRE